MQALNCKSYTLITGFLSWLLIMLNYESTAQSYNLSQSGTYNIEITDPTFFDANPYEITQIPIGFNFTFYGNTYSDCYVGGNGFITFSSDPGNYCCGNVLPHTELPNNLIAVAWTNIGSSSTHYELFGDAPYRRLVITFDLRNQCDETYYGQVKLFETTNVIEIHTQQWDQDQCLGWNTTQGLENIDATEAIEVPGRNFNDTWHVDNGDEDFVSFTPIIPSTAYVLSQAGTYTIEIDNPTYFDVYGDDATQIPIGFNFSFFGVPYTDCWVGGDGFISFGDYPGGGCCGQPIPSAGNPNNLIAVAWTNMDYSAAHYEIFGDAPNRRLVITLDYANSCDESYYGQVKLYETTNVIEIHTQQWYQDDCSGWNSTMGLENADGTQAVEVPGRNYNYNWSIQPGDDDFVSFTPYVVSTDIIYVVDEPNDFNLEFVSPHDVTVTADSAVNVPIGFDFDFFGIPYSDCYLTFDGFLSFGTTASGCCAGQSIPDPGGPNNIIAAGWIGATNDDCCFNNEGYNIFSYETIGDAPNRRFVAYFLLPETCGQYYRGEIKLFEGSNIIEIHTDQWAAYNTPCHNATQGIENGDGTEAYYLPGRNASTSWSVISGTNDVVRFSPMATLPIDAGVTEITDEGFCTGLQQMSAVIKNFGGDAIDSVDVEWEFDGIAQAPVHFVGNIPVDSDTLINLGSKTLAAGQNYSIRVWTSLPNNTTDENNPNDTLSTSMHSSLAGTFTIGGSNPDYASFVAAVADLSSIGICDTIIMNVRPGTYTEQFIIPYIPGSDLNQITFRAENGDSTSVTLQYTATVANANYVVRLDSTQHIVLEKMTLKALGTNFARVIEFKDYTHDNLIQHCVINGRNAAVSTPAFACIYSDAFNFNNRISSCTIRNGAYGYYHLYDSNGGGGSLPPVSIQLRDNTFLEFYNKAIYADHTKAIQITNNLIQSSKSGVRGIEVVNEADTLVVSGNNIYLSAGTIGLWLENLFPPSGKRARIFNNMINVTGNSSFAGAGLYNCSLSSFFHNSIRTDDPDGSYTFYLQSGSGIQDSVYNNIIVNTGNGPVVYASTSYLFNSMDYNDYYTTSPLFGSGFNNGVIYAENLNQWKHGTNLDAHSLNINPLFSSNTNLHTTNHLLNGVGTPLVTTSKDIDGNTRNSLHPDPGADEFTPSIRDAGITQILSPALTCNAEQNVEVVLSNLGADTLHQVTIKWTLNGIARPDVIYAHDILPEGDTAHVILSQLGFSNHPDTLKIWTTLPNGGVDTQFSNDTIKYRFRLPLNGTYTIGGTNPDFTTFKKAVDDLNLYQVCGPVLFRFRNGTYTDQVVIDSMTSLSAVNTVTFESASLDSSTVFIKFINDFASTNHSNVVLNGADYITFRHLGFQALTDVNVSTIEARNNATHLTFSHCRFEGAPFNSFNNYIIRSFSNTGVQSFITIDHNYFLNGSYGIAMYNTFSATDFHINDNHFVNQVAKAIDIVNTKNLFIQNNKVESTAATNFTGIDLDNAYQTTEISGNYINTNNGNGLYLNTSNGNVRVFNNMIKVAGSAIGMNFWNCVNTRISFNSSRATGTGHGIEIAGGDSLQLKDNIFRANSGRAISSFAPPVHILFDYNALYSTTGPIGYWNDITYSTMAAWQTAYGFDIHSINIDPQFVSATDLHILADTLDGAGVPIAGIAVDFDNNARNATNPDIGADEIGANSNDAGVFAILPEMPFARGIQDVKAVIRNFGGNTITSTQVHWKLNNVAQTPYTYTGSLPTLQQDTVILGQVNFALSTPYIIKSWTAQPNGVADLYNINDTLTTNTRYPAVSDTLTIGGAAPDLANFTAALTALSLGGVLDSVHFQLRNGTYHAVFTIPQTLGMNCNTPIIFESESGNPADVIWDNASLSNHTLVIDGADGLRFKNLTIRTVQAAYHAVYFTNGANCNKFIGCVIEGVTTTSTSLAQVTILSYDTYNNDVEFIGNTVRGGSYGIYWLGAYNSSTGARVENNIFENSYYCGLTMVRLIAPVIRHNSVSSNTAHSYPYGMQITEASLNAVITSNQVLFNGKRGVGIYMAASNGNASQRSLVANNFVVLGNSSNSYGIQQAGCNFSNVYNNTVRLTGGNTSGFPYIRQYSMNVNLRNNIFDNRSDGVAMYLETNEGPLTSDYNDLYSTGTNIVYYNGTNYHDLAAWHASGLDMHSISEDPMYVSSSGFAITGAALNAAGIPLAEVPNDIQNQPRDPSTPDIGCDEISLFNNDVGILSINYPKQPFPSGINTVFIKFVNNGQDTLTSMHVDWEVDGHPQPTYIWTGLLPSAGTYDSLDIGEYNFAPYQTHSIKAWVSLPNAFEDELATNDTLETGNLFPGLLGTYTIGGVNPDFDSLVTAVNVLNQGGAAGPVTFNIRTGIYLETLVINDFPGSDCDNPVIFKSESGDSSSVTITNLGIDQTTLTLNGADGVIFKNLTIESVNPAFRNAVKYYNGAHCNQFLNNHLKGFESSSTDINHAVIISSNTLDTANVIKNNWIQFGAAGIYVSGNGAPTNTLIQNNFLDQNQYVGIYASVESGIKILQNTITNSSGYQYYEGVYLQYCYGKVQIESNTIHAEPGRYGLHIESCAATANERGRIVNNFLIVSGNSEIYGLLINSSEYYDVLHNNVLVHSSYNGFALYYHSDNSLNIVNNIFSNEGAGYAVYENNQPGLISNYNNFYHIGAFGFWNGGGLADLSNWQIASGQDANSHSVNPQFMSESNLHVSNIILNGAGQTIPSVTTDIDGNTRNTPPDIGADEFNPSIPNDAGVFSYFGPHQPFPSGSNQVRVTLKNYGSNLLTSADIRWLVNGVEQPVYHWTGSLASAVCDTVILGNFNFAPGTDHDLIFWSQMPNGVSDNTHSNDTLDAINIYPGLIGTYTIGGVLPDFNLFSQVEAALNSGGTLGDVTFNIRNGIYSTQLLINNFPRLSASDKVIFQSETGDSSLVTIERNFYSPVNNYIVRLSNAHHIRFQRIGFSTNQGHGIEIDDASSDININHCRFTAPQLLYQNGTFTHIYSNTNSEDTLYIANNRFNQGSVGIQLSASWGDLEKNVTIINNHFNNCFYRSIDVAFDDGLTLKGNTTYNTNMYVYQAISVTASVNVKDISNNDIRLLGGGSCGLNLLSVYGTAMSPTPISNNYILIRNGTYNQVGIAHAYGDYNNFNYNTVRIENAAPGSIAFTDYNSLQHIHLRNCNFANYSGGMTIYNSWAPNYSSNTMDYCNLYTTGQTLAQYYGTYANLSSLQAGVIQNLHGKSAEPLFPDDGPSVLQAALNGTAIPIAGVTTDIYGMTRNASTPDIGAREFTLPPHDIGAKLLVSPATYCGLGNAVPVTIKIQNYGANTETGFNVAFSVNGSGWTVENVGSLSVTPGGTADFTFIPTVNMSQVGVYSFSMYTSMGSDQNIHNDTVWNVQVQHIPALTQTVSNMLPVNGATSVEKPVSLSWNPAPNATHYDVYVWKSSLPQPSTPFISDLVSINTSDDLVQYGETYSWQVVAKNSCNQMQASPIQQFTVRELPDLVVDSISVPLMAVSGQQIQVEWQVKNNGEGSTQSALWTDAVYLSLDATLNTSFDTYLGGVQNLTALQPDESYLQTGTFTIPQGFTGNYYVFVYSNRYNNVIETLTNNNWKRTTSQIQITLVPPPDLVIDQVVTSATAFSGSTFSVHYTGRNNGNGAIGNVPWKDRIKISEDGSTSAGGTILTTLNIQGPLAPDSTYDRTINVTIPNAIFGQYYIYVETDIQNQVYEQAADNNNYGRSDTMNIILTPPPNLIVTGTTVPATLHTNAYMNFNWTVQNSGGSSPTEPYWYDNMYLSLSPVYNTNFLAPLLSSVRYGPLQPAASYTGNTSARLPEAKAGQYYIYTYADRNNNVFEHTFENDNYTRFGPYNLVNPDIEPVITSLPAVANAGNNIPVSWSLVNHGPGKVIDRYIRYRYFISTVDTFSIEGAQEIKTTSGNFLNIDSGDSVHIQTTLTLPQGLNDHFYLYIRAESIYTMFEQNDAYANNVGRSITFIDIDPGPYPDLKTTMMSSPDTVTAGEPVSIQYTQINQGGTAAATRGVEAVYISFSPVWDIQFAQLLSEATYSTSLAKDSTVIVNRSVIVPANITSNVYYLYVISDKNNIVFEYTGENNNAFRSSPMFVKPYPPVNIAIENVVVPDDTLYTGIAYTFHYNIHNLQADPIRHVWGDAIYLSVDSTFNMDLDLLVSNYNVTIPPLMPGSNFPITASGTIPNGIQGDYYVFVRGDIENLIGDVQLNNNINLWRAPGGQAKKIFIKLSHSPDLLVSAINSPATAVGGQQLSVSYTIQNAGNGPAPTWLDRIYLSSDGTISQGALLLYENRRSQSLAAGGNVIDTVAFNIPGYLNGNYFMIVRTDFLDELYEYNGESNNNTSFIIQVTTPPPSDLIVDVITLPDSLLAGDVTTINWTTKNHGSFPAQGSVREIVYLSPDTIWNVEDQVFGFKQSPFYLPPQSSHSETLTAPVLGVVNQNYFALVRTDAINNVIENNETNNISSSIDPAYIDVKRLLYDSLMTDTLHPGMELYYKLLVDPTLEGESILVTLSGDSVNAYNELFISFDDAPTRGNFQISNNKALSGTQKVVIRNAQVGTYYILGYGSNNAATSQPIKLSARVMTYEILAVTPDKGSNEGTVTVVIEGSRLDSTYAVRLRADDTTGFVLLADTFIIVSPEKIIAKFNLRGVSPRFYNVECQIEPYYVAVLENGFEVIDGMGADLQVNWFLSPGSSGPRNRPVKIVLEMINNGNADVQNKFIRVYSPYGNVIAHSYDDLISGQTYPYIDVPVQLQDGFENTLPPGNSAMYEVFSWLHPYPFFIIDVQ
ncbi:MAG TPA: CARDB domain-containing protein [Saprospiraceae bacterium]|nr:CARDB domain-containing protein [Saprospiraceae bacterium]